MSASRRCSTALRSARLSSASVTSAAERSSCEPSPLIWRSISCTSSLVFSRWRSRLRNCSLTSVTCPWSRCCCCCSRSRSRRICSSRARDWLRSSCAGSIAGAVIAMNSSRKTCRARTSDLPQVAADTHQRAAEAQQHTEGQEAKDLQWGEELQADAQAHPLRTEAEEHQQREQHREHATQESLDGSLQEEWPADEPVSGTHQSHDPDLAGAVQHGD